jgi:hypothetical protein
MLQNISFNIIAIIVCIVVNMIIGALWYSPLMFGKAWLSLTGRKAEEITKEDGNKSMSFAIIPAAVSAFGLALLVGIAQPGTIFDALVIGSLASVVFSGMSALNLVLFEGRTLKLSLLHTGYFIVSWNIVSIILTLWK